MKNPATRRDVARFAALSFAAPWLAIPQQGAAQEPLRVEDEVWRDEARKRDVPMRIRWPRIDAATSASTPVIVYSHGLGGSRGGGSVWGEAWAQAGFVVLHMQHAGSDTPAVRNAVARGSLSEAFAPEQHLARFADVKFVLDEVDRRQRAGQGNWVRVRAQGAGMAGHSFGAGTTLGMARRGFAGAASIDEPRFAAFIAFSPAMTGPGDPRQLLASATRPILTLTGSLDGDVIGNGATPEARAAVFDQLPAGNKAGLVLQDADHMTFGGNSASGLVERNLTRTGMRRPAASVAQETQHHKLVAQITTDWWQAHLRGHTQATARLAERPRGLAVGDVWRRG